jgi:hypothetical protein
MNLIDRGHQVEKIFHIWHRRRLVWGLFDCAQLAADMAYELTGTNPLASWPAYQDEVEAMRTIRAAGFKSLRKAVSSFAKPLPGPLFALAGDIVALPSNKRSMPALGVCLGPDAVLCFWSDLDDAGKSIAGTSMARRLDMKFADAAWRIS